MTSEEAIKIFNEVLLFGKAHCTQAEFEELARMSIEALEQEPRKGHWIFKKTVFDKFGNTVECSSCHKKWKTYDDVRWIKENKYCFNCGADMRGEE